MKSWLPLFSGAVVLIGTLFGGWLHGRMLTRIWADDLLVDAGRRLERPLNEQHGNWRMVKETPFSADVVRMLQCPAHINRTYIHQQTGDIVHVAVILGPPGPISVHTPEVCYESQDFTISGSRESVTLVDRQQLSHTFWHVSMEEHGNEETSLRVYYAWGTGGVWTATDDPRFAHAGEPYLYKIQLAHPVNDAADEFNPCQDFLSWFLPEVQAILIPTNQDSAGATPASHK